MREYFINLDFDLSLRRDRPKGTVDARARTARELVMHMLLMGVEGDSVLVPTEPDEDFVAYLARAGIPVPATSLLPSLTGDARFTPFGWNDEADRINRGYSKPTPHPPLEVVRRVNGRVYSAELERRHWGDEHCFGVVRSVGDLLEALARGRHPEHGWVVKSEHGNGAFGNRRLRSRDLGNDDRKTLARLFREDEAAVVEPWRERVHDLASVFDVDPGGVAVGFRTYEVVNTADGALIGDVFDRDLPAVQRWGHALQGMAAVIARELADAGYAGPVCVDSFVWNDGGVERLRPVVDINARLFMAAAVERLWRSWDRDRVLFWRLFSRRKLRIPDAAAQIEEELADAAYDPNTRCGILLSSPLRVEGRRPGRVGFAFSGRDRASVEALDRWFRGRFER